MSLCKIAIIGNLGGDPETRYTANGTRVLSFSVAVNRFRTSPDGQRIEETEWFRVSAFGRLAELDQYLAKGRRVYIDGRFSSRQFQGQDGQMRTSLEIAANDIQFFEPRRDAPAEPGHEPEPRQAPGPRPAQAPRPAPAAPPDEIDDLPF